MDIVDFNEFMVRPKLDAKARKQSMWMAEQIAAADSVSAHKKPSGPVFVLIGVKIRIIRY